MHNTNKFLVSILCLLPIGLQAQIDFFLGEYTQIMRQTADDKLVPFGFSTNYQYGGNYIVFASIITSGETITGGTLTGPSYPSGLALEYFPEDGEYSLEADVRSIEELEAIVAPGAYTFSGSGNTVGSFSETVTFPVYAPLTPLKVTNFNELQSIDISQPVTIQWEEFTQGQGAGISGGYAGLINVEITGYNQFDVEDTWDSELLHPGDAFGLLPTTTSVTIPAGTFKSDYIYVVNMFFARIDQADPASGIDDALLVNLTGYELEFNIYPQGNQATWAGFPVSLEGFVNIDWTIGESYIPLAPWVWSAQLDSWVFMPEESAWFTGWIYFKNLAEGTPELGLSMVDGTNFGYSHVLEKWMYVVPGSLEAGSGWVVIYPDGFSF